MDTAATLKQIIHTPTVRRVRTHECEISSVKDDPDGERLTLSIKVVSDEENREQVFQLGGIHISTTPQQLDSVIMGAIHAFGAGSHDLELKNSEACSAKVSTPAAPGSPRAVQPSDVPDAYPGLQVAENSVQLKNVDAGLNINQEKHYRESLFGVVKIGEFPNREAESPKSNENAITQIKGLQQWHPNACGYHALFNLAMTLISDHDGDMERQLAIDEPLFWSFVFQAMARLKKYRDETGVWKTAKLEKAILDTVHLEYLINTDPLLCGNITVTDTVEGLSTTVTKYRRLKQRHGFVLGCSSHWISGALLDENSFLLMDSHNKPLTSIHSSDVSQSLAHSAIEAYRPAFREKMKEVWRYEHYPDDVLDRMFDDGIPEYWRGTVKDKMWWHHRPARVRLEILFRELERARAYLEALRAVFNPHKIQKEAIDSEMTTGKAQILPIRPIRRSQQIFPGVYTNLTHELDSLTGFIRRDEELSSSNAEFDPTAPPTIYNRKRPPPPEIQGDAFDRQRVIPGFDQTTIERQSCLVIGTGGIGMNVALTLARLGVHEICMVDYDKYDASNLTRQCLGTRSDVGARKTEVAMRNIQSHNLRSKIRTLEADVVKDWHKVVDAARRCTVIFNCCDAGLMVDYAINALSKELNIPLCCGQSFGWKFMSEFYTGCDEYNCAFCQESTRSSFSCGEGQRVYDRLRAFAKNDSINELDQVDEFLSEDSAFRIDSGSVVGLFKENDNNGENLLLPITDAQSMDAFLDAYHIAAIKTLLPGHITSLKSLGFVPRSSPPSTRYVGSWVCPCLACGVICVSHWCQYITGPCSANRNPPTCILFNMDEGMTAEEQMAYECGMALTKEDRSFAKTVSNPKCQVCDAAKGLKKQREAMLTGSQVVFLRPVIGEGSQLCIKPLWVLAMSDEQIEDRKQQHIKEASNSRAQLPLLPQVPAFHPIVEEPCDDFPNESLLWPFVDLGALPLLKTCAEDALDWPGTIKGFASGIRSAIVHCAASGKTYRLKGCGNNDQGFPLEVKGDDGVSLSLRGCVFEHTAARELYMTEYIARECGVFCGNIPLGYYRYPTNRPSTKNDNLVWDAPEIDKFCVVFETKGERRLGDHLLVGLERLLLQLATEKEVEWITKKFKENVRFFENDHLLDTASVVEGGLSNLVDFSSYEDEPSDDGKTHLVFSLAKRLGWECGTILSQLALGDVSWGTFRDAMGVHCNAHANNLVVVYPFMKDCTHILAAVDFDMAFTRTSYVSEAVETSALLPTEFDEIIRFEQTMGMRTSLAGSDFASTAVSNDPRMAVASPKELLLRSALRDMVILGFDLGLLGKLEEFTFHSKCRELVEAALTLTAS